MSGDITVYIKFEEDPGKGVEYRVGQCGLVRDFFAGFLRLLTYDKNMTEETRRYYTEKLLFAIYREADLNEVLKNPAYEESYTERRRELSGAREPTLIEHIKNLPNGNCAEKFTISHGRVPNFELALANGNSMNEMSDRRTLTIRHITDRTNDVFSNDEFIRMLVKTVERKANGEFLNYLGSYRYSGC